jgi:hypothetical protein
MLAAIVQLFSPATPILSPDHISFAITALLYRLLGMMCEHLEGTSGVSK